LSDRILFPSFFLLFFCSQVPEYCNGQSTEEAVTKNAFKLLFAFDEVVTLGYRESVTVQQIKTNTTMDSHEEKLQKIIYMGKVNEAREEARRKAEELDRKKKELISQMRYDSMDSSLSSFLPSFLSLFLLCPPSSHFSRSVRFFCFSPTRRFLQQLQQQQFYSFYFPFLSLFSF
jgi:hypothetical protein